MLPRMTLNLNESAAAEVRAEMARQRLSAPALAGTLGWQTHVLRRRLNGEVAFNLAELHEVAEALNVPPSSFITPAPEPAAS